MKNTLKFGFFGVAGICGLYFIANSPIMTPVVLNLLNVSPANIASVKEKDQYLASAAITQPTAQASTPEVKVTSTPAPAASPAPKAQDSASCKEPDASKDARKVGVTHYKYSEADISKLVQLEGEENGMRLLPNAAKAYSNMKAKAKAAGVNLEVASGFRSVEDQYLNFESKAAKDPSRPLSDLVKFNSIAGFSEHHTGLALDIASKEYPSLNTGHAESAAGKWLLANAKASGFELSFGPKNVNGVGFEPWHWRYVGDADSKAVFCYVSTNDSKINPN